MDTVTWQSLGRAVGAREGYGSPKHLSPPRGEQELAGCREMLRQ